MDVYAPLPASRALPDRPCLIGDAADPDGFHAAMTRGPQVNDCVLDQDTARRWQPEPGHHFAQHRPRRLGQQASGELHLLDRHHAVEHRADAKRGDHAGGIGSRRVGDHHLAPGQPPQQMHQSHIAPNQLVQIRERMGLAQEVMHIDRVVADHAKQGRAIASPVGAAQETRLRLIQAGGLHHIVGHRPIDARHDVGQRVMQGVVEVEQPDRSTGRQIAWQCPADHLGQRPGRRIRTVMQAGASRPSKSRLQ